MSRSPNHSALGRPKQAVKWFAVFLAMAIVEWRKLVADVAHAFARSRDPRGTSKPQDGER